MPKCRLSTARDARNSSELRCDQVDYECNPDNLGVATAALMVSEGAGLPTMGCPVHSLPPT